jgi:hypothetical protein
MSATALTVNYKYFWAMSKTWDDMFTEAAAFAASVGRERLISISHSQDGIKGVIAVWYWGEPESTD